MKIAVTGSSGFIGEALVRALVARGDEVVRVVRSGTSGDGRALWDPRLGRIDVGALEGVEAAVNLSGEPIGKRRWTLRQKGKILESRVEGTSLLARTLADLSPRPLVLVSASAMGFYGDRGDEILTEEASSGDGFLAMVCRQWETAAGTAADAGIRVVYLRTGLVLGRQGGLLKRVLLPFRAGLGGKLGNGRQYMSWVSLGDQIGAILHLLDDEGANGPFNIVAPEPVRNAEFTHILARVLHRPAAIPIPKALIAIPFGRELTDDLLASIRVIPARLQHAGYRFMSEQLEPALRTMLGR